jgi:hypothetical protein
MNIIHILEGSFDLLRDNYLGLLLVVFVWGVIDIVQITNYKGEIKRGIRIWSKPLSNEVRQYLSQLTTDYIDENFLSIHQSFIRVKDHEILVCYKSWILSTPFQYVGYVNLALPNSRLEFRSSLPLHLFLALLSLYVWTIPFVVVVLVISFVSGIAGLQRILNKLASKDPTRHKD